MGTIPGTGGHGNPAPRAGRGRRRFHHKPQYVVLDSVRDGSEFAHVICRHAGRSYAPDEEDSGDYSTPQDEAALSHALENRSLMLTALCRRQADGTWRLIAERNLFFLPQMSIVT